MCLFQISVNSSISNTKPNDDCAWSDSSADIVTNNHNDGTDDDNSENKSANIEEPETESTVPLKNCALTRAVSADDVAQWVKSQENLTSSITSDSYEFDDVFVAYTEDDSSGKTKNQRETETLESIRNKVLSRRRSSNVLDYSGASSALSQRTDEWLNELKSPWADTASSASSSRYPRLGDVRNQLPTWCNMVSESENTEGIERINSLSYEESVTDSSAGTSHRDLLQLGDWGTHKSSETASNVSFCSTEVPYAFELNLQEKIKISDKPIKCLLETR